MERYQISLFELLREQLGKSLPIVHLTKATLVHISHTLEDIVLRHRLPAMLFTGFQESSHWAKETQRYRELAGIAKQVCVFAGKPLDENSPANQFHFELRGDDPLRQEWFVLILAERFSVLLCGQDRVMTVENDAERSFATFWSFEPAVIEYTLDLLETVVESYDEDRLRILRETRAGIPVRMPDLELITEFSREIIIFEELLQDNLRRMLTQQQEHERLRGQLEKERELSSQKTQFITTVSHEFRTPLAAILASAEMLDRYRNRMTPDDQQRRLSLIRDQINHLTMMLDEMDVVLQAESSGLRFQPSLIELKPMLTRLVEVIRVTDAAQHEIVFRYEGSRELVVLDERLFHYIVINLLSNAVKYSPSGHKIYLVCTVSRDAVHLRVQDSGIGIPPEEKKYLFRSFFRASNVGTIGGTGLGLRIVKECVDLHQGTITVRSSQPSGTVFEILLPQHDHPDT